jgi:hypothetical protein
MRKTPKSPGHVVESALENSNYTKAASTFTATRQSRSVSVIHSNQSMVLSKVRFQEVDYYLGAALR